MKTGNLYLKLLSFAIKVKLFVLKIFSLHNIIKFTIMKEKRKEKRCSPHAGYNLGAKKIGRNEPCPCGSGKKAKNCCGTETQYYGRKL